MGPATASGIDGPRRGPCAWVSPSPRWCPASSRPARAQAGASASWRVLACVKRRSSSNANGSERPGALGLYESDQQVRPTGSCHAGGVGGGSLCRGVGGGSLCAVFFLPSDSRGPPSHNVPQSRSSTGSTGMPAAYTTGPRRSASPSGLLPLHRFPLGLHSMAWHRCHAVTPTASPTTFRLFSYSRSTVRSTAFAEPMQRTEGPMQTERQQRRASPTHRPKHGTSAASADPALVHTLLLVRNRLPIG
jgi:hypothetical protein